MKNNTRDNLQGVGVALVTPFGSDGGVDYAALGRLVDYVIEGGVNYLVALGTTAETPTLSCDEKRAVFDFVRTRNAGRLPLVVGIGGNDTSKVVSDLKSWDFAGVEAVLSVTPYYNRPSQEGLYQHYKAVAAASPRPVILYNVPPRTGVNLTAETTLRLAREVPNLAGIKEACGDIVQIKEILSGRPAGFRVISGDDGMALPLIEAGGDGVISVAANAYPKQLAEMVGAALDGDKALASKLETTLTEPIEALFAEGNPTGIKTTLAVRGIAENRLRLPLVAGSDALRARIAALIETHKL